MPTNEQSVKQYYFITIIDNLQSDNEICITSNLFALKTEAAYYDT